LRLPDIVPPKPPRIRELDLHRQPTGGFGFSLRKGIITEKGGGDNEETKHFVIFAEPGSGPKAPQTGLIVTVLIDCGLLVLALRILFGFGAGIGVNFLGSGIGRTDRSRWRR
jgi:hypothetical protein